MSGYLDRNQPPHIFTLVMATAVSALASNVFLPSLTRIADYFEADYAVAQLMVSIYLAATALLQIVIGPASDRFGRRPVMLVCLMIFVVGTLTSLWAPTIEILLAARVLQSFSAAGMVLARAIVRDTVNTEESASRIGYITMGMALVPMVAPAIGGLLDEIYGWHASFLLMLGFGITAFLLVFFDLGETNKNTSTSMMAQIRAYPQLLRLSSFWCYAVTAAFTSGTFFTLIGAGPFIAIEILGLQPSEFGLFLGLISLGYVGGNFLSGRYSRRIGLNRMMLAGSLSTVIGIVISIGLFTAGIHHPLSLFGPMILLGVGNGMTLPNSSAGIVSVNPRMAGSASGLGGTIQLGLSAIISTISSLLVTVETGILTLFYMMSFCSLVTVTAISLLLFIQPGKTKSV